ncbi:hypothetical protein SLEP1_g39309 [Rubroshorea leprosula]|uniref:MATH domain-containing protein n=1 Tax=Rubroshorea leprosula TaxID=152421 RepID=A0AAV5KZS4_9ROSI|nr:hypothetical protein SLEP1_g39309 [Rubroshorea leprosula]
MPSPVGSPTSSQSVTQTVNGSHSFTIKGYSLAKGMGIGKHIASQSFTVGGYQWAIYFYPDGKNPEDNSTYVSVFVALASEGTEFRALFDLTLLDQSGRGKHKVHSHFDRSRERPLYAQVSGQYVVEFSTVIVLPILTWQSFHTEVVSKHNCAYAVCLQKYSQYSYGNCSIGFLWCYLFTNSFKKAASSSGSIQAGYCTAVFLSRSPRTYPKEKLWNSPMSPPAWSNSPVEGQGQETWCTTLNFPPDTVIGRSSQSKNGKISLEESTQKPMAELAATPGFTDRVIERADRIKARFE